MFGISAFSEAPFSSLRGTFVYVTLTGVSATGNVGTISSVVRTVPLTGVQASGFAGTMIYNESDVTTGDVATGLVGAVTSVISVALTSVSATGAVNTVSFAQVGFLTTDLATGFVGTAAPVISVSISGVQAAGSVGTVTSIYWRLVDDSQTANWQNVNNSQ